MVTVLKSDVLDSITDLHDQIWDMEYQLSFLKHEVNELLDCLEGNVLTPEQALAQLSEKRLILGQILQEQEPYPTRSGSLKVSFRPFSLVKSIFNLFRSRK